MIHELEKMCLDANFDRKRAIEIIKQIDVNQEFVSSEYNFKTVLLDFAAKWANVPMVELLLGNGADPNHVYANGTENVLWHLQYSRNDKDKNETRLHIVKLLLENGANPHLQCEGFDLLDWANFYWGAEDEGVQYEYRWKFICLLEDFER